jgi:predicted alpha/beta-hydrolase family hydrolase
MDIRAFYRAAKVETAKPPYDTIHLKVTYPAKMSSSETESNGVIPVDRSKAPFPVVIFLNGYNCGAEVYQWLAIELVRRGLVVVTYNWITKDFSGMANLTPGINVAAYKPENYGNTPTSSALPTLLNELECLQTEGILAGMLALDKIILGGHSAGGRAALESSDRRFFPQLAAVFSYGAHSLGNLNLGYKPGTILPLPNSIPTLLMGGTCDGLIYNNSKLYGINYENPTTPIARTFSEAIIGGRNDCYLVLLEGANHFAIANPIDNTVGTGFLDFPSTQPEDKIRALISETIGLFIETHVCDCVALPAGDCASASQSLDRLLDSNNSLIYACERK